MSRYTNVKVRISDTQKEKLAKALQTGCDSISIRLTFEDLIGEDILALTKSQLTMLSKAYDAKKGLTIKMSKTQIAHNMKVEGGFLPLLAALAAKAIPVLTGTVLPALGVGALSGLASTGVQKLVGNGLYLKKGGCVCQIETDGSGLYLGPSSGKGLESLGNGLYVKKKGNIYDGKGLLLGPNSPFKDIPFLGMLL